MRGGIAVCGSVLLAVTLWAAAPGHADVFRPAYLELQQQSAEVYDVLWKVPAQGDRRLALDLHLPDGTTSLSAARGEFAGTAYIERSRVQRVGGLEGSRIGVDGLAGTGTDVLVRVVRLDGSEQVERLLPATSSFVVTAPAGQLEIANTYLVLGIQHILVGADHLLFVLALLLIVGRFRRILLTVTAFTLAHSITLALATLGIIHVPSAPVEAAIALSIVFVAAEIVRGIQGRPGITAQSPWLVAFIFGLLHGLGFAGALSDVGLPAAAIPLALASFNIGVELGQLAFVALATLATWLIRRAPLRWPHWAQLTPAYAVGCVAMFWTIQRVFAL